MMTATAYTWPARTRKPGARRCSPVARGMTARCPHAGLSAVRAMVPMTSRSPARLRSSSSRATGSTQPRSTSALRRPPPGGPPRAHARTRPRGTATSRSGSSAMPTPRPRRRRSSVSAAPSGCPSACTGMGGTMSPSTTTTRTSHPVRASRTRWRASGPRASTSSPTSTPACGRPRTAAMRTFSTPRSRSRRRRRTSTGSLTSRGTTSGRSLPCARRRRCGSAPSPTCAPGSPTTAWGPSTSTRSPPPAQGHASTRPTPTFREPVRPGSSRATGRC